MPSGSHRLDALAGAIGAAAEAASLEELAGTAFPLLGEALEACPGIVFAVGEDRPMPVALGGQARTIFPLYMERIASDDPLFRVSASMIAPVHVPLHHADQKAFKATRAYTDFYRAYDIAHKLYVRFAGARLASPGALSMGLTRGRRQRDFGSQDVALAGLALPAFQAAARRIFASEHCTVREAVEALADRAGRNGVLALDRSGHLLWMSPRARALIDRSSLPPSLVIAARRLAGTAISGAVRQAPLELRVCFQASTGVGIDAELSIARTVSGERIVAVGLEQTDPPHAQVAATAERFALTRAEAGVLAAMTNGLSNAGLASRFGIALPTVKTHVHRLIQKLGVTSRVQAVLLARKLN